MKFKEKDVRDMIEQIDSILHDMKVDQMSHQTVLEEVKGIYRKSSRNLIHYNTLRKQDIRSLQKKLKNLGMSRLDSSGSHIRASLLNSRYILYSLLGEAPKTSDKAGLSIKNAKRLQNKFAKELLGHRSKGRRVRIMVTQPTESAYDYSIVYNMVKNGMNCARINCAHDDPQVWQKMIDHIQKASKVFNRKVGITMDLAGPKIRTGAIVPGAKVRKFSPERDEMGNVTAPATIVLTDKITEDSGTHTIPVNSEWLNQLTVGDICNFTDTRKKERKLKIVQVLENEVYANCYDTSYIGTGVCINKAEEDAASTIVGELPPIEQSIVLKKGDLITLNKPGVMGNPAQYDEEGNLTRQANISCQASEVFERVRTGEAILFDDGKIEGVIESCHMDSLEIRIIRAKESGSKLKAEKGINFPNSDLRISGLTSKDREDLHFVAKHADVINFSFVNTSNDVEELFEELKKLDAFDKVNIILKIETKKAFDNLTEILLSAMRTKYIGVMIARGDLAIETGWNNIGWVQKEILAICNAAHVPVVWATQVLESLAKKGLPSRSEITDATMSLKSECVMLNKGTYINDAIALLNGMLGGMEKFDEKDEIMLPKMEKLLPDIQTP